MCLYVHSYAHFQGFVRKQHKCRIMIIISCAPLSMPNKSCPGKQLKLHIQTTLYENEYVYS